MGAQSYGEDVSSSSYMLCAPEKSVEKVPKAVTQTTPIAVAGKPKGCGSVKKGDAQLSLSWCLVAISFVFFPSAVAGSFGMHSRAPLMHCGETGRERSTAKAALETAVCAGICLAVLAIPVGIVAILVALGSA